MSTYINTEVTLGASENKIIPLNRWGRPNVTVQITSITGSVSIEGTLAKINQGETATWGTLSQNDGGSDLSNVSATGVYNIDEGAFEAIRLVTSASSSVEAKVAQQGRV